MSRVYLIRHGQAGLRHNYDTLSDLGCKQAEELRSWFGREGIALDRVISGSLTRQKETARLAAGDPVVDPRLAEFDLDAVYRSLAPALCRMDAQFKQEYEEMMHAMKTDDAPVHRQWNRCDVMVFKTWHLGTLPVEGESWEEFKARAVSAMDLVRAVGSRERVAIFTSATPIGLLLASLLGIDDSHAMRMAGACYNSSVTTLRVHDGEVSLIGYNAVAHLSDPSMRTFR
jgi:broad specificity phosphatase PhoE